MVRIDILIGSDKSAIMMTSNGKKNIIFSDSTKPEEVLFEVIKKTRSKSLRVHTDSALIRDIVMTDYSKYKGKSKTIQLLLAEFTTRFVEVRPPSPPNMDILNAALSDKNNDVDDSFIPHDDDTTSGSPIPIPDIPEVSFEESEECNDDADPFDVANAYNPNPSTEDAEDPFNV